MPLLETTPDGLSLHLYTQAHDSHRTTIHDAIKAFNDATIPAFHAARQPGRGLLPLELYLLDAEGRLIGGVTSGTIWGWLRVHDLWISDLWRAQGLGSRLLLELEATAARLRDCTRAELHTFDFQARGFYERHGYCVVGQLDDYPPGHCLYWLRKDFTASATAHDTRSATQ